MKKRLLALLTALALLVSCVPAGVLAEGTEQVPEIPVAHSHGAAHACEHCQTETIEWTAWGDDEAEKTTLPGATGHYYLVADISVGATTDVKNSADVVLCLNGYSVDAAQNCYIYRIGTNNSTTDQAKLTVSDCTAYTDDAGVYHAGALMNGKGKDGGGAFFLRGASSLYMYGGKLTGHQNTQTSATAGYGGGAIASRNTATIHLENVEVSNCSTTTEGGAIGARDSVQITLENVTFRDNTATKDGGAIFLASANNSLQATDCRFIHNVATVNGGAISANGGSTVTVSGGTFHDNEATKLGGAIYANKSDVTITGTAGSYVELTENYGAANANAGAVYATGSCDVQLRCVLLEGNRVKNSGGSALMFTGGVRGKLTDVTATGNKNESVGDYHGAVYVTGTVSTLTLSGKVVIKDNSPNDLFVQNNNYNRTNDDCWVVLDGLGEGSQIRLCTYASVAEDEEMLNSRILDGQIVSWSKDWIVYSANDMAVDYDAQNDKFFFTDNTPVPIHLHCDCGDGTDAHCAHTENGYLPWTQADALPVSGCYYLETDVALPENVRVDGALKLCLNGHTIRAEHAQQGDTKDRIFTMNADDRLTLSDCTAKAENGVYTAGKLTGSSYTAVMVANSSTSDNTVVIDFYDGIFTENSSSAGAAFSIQDGATLNMYGGEISDNHSTKLGGALYVGSNGTFNLYGGTITGNTADGNGTVHVTGSQLGLYGGTITGNSAAAGGGIYATKSSVTLGGTPAVTGNTAGGSASNLYLAGASQITFAGLGQGEGKIGISADTAPCFLSGDMGQTDVTQYFTPDSQYRILENKDNRLYLTYTSDHGHCACAGDSTHCDHAENVWLPWESATSLPTAAGYYYLLSDVTLTTYAEFSAGHVRLCLNGHKVTANGEEGTKYDRFFTISKDACLTITDCTAACAEDGTYTAGAFTGASAGFLMVQNQTADGESNNVTINFYEGIIAGNAVTGSGGVIAVQDRAVFNLYGGRITGNTGKLDADGNGGMGAAFYVGTDSVLNMYGGEITGNTCEGSGTVYVTANSVFNMAGGTISGNTAAANGGAVLLNGAQTVMTMTGGTISGNQAKNAGGIVAQAKATLDLQGGSVTGNIATGNGGGAFISTNSTLRMSGGEIRGNTAENYAGGVYLFGATATISGGTISENTARNGGGLAVRLGERTVDGQKVTDVPSAVTMTGGELTGNKASEVGGGMLVHGAGSVFCLKEGKLSGNDAPNGGGIITQGSSEFHLEGGEVTGNTAKNGGGIYVSYTTSLHQSGGKISNNTVTGNGGGIYCLGARLELTGGSVSGNYAKTSGGGIYANKYTRFAGTPEEITYTSVIDLKGVSVSGNTTAGNGAGICTSKNAVVNLSAGSVSGNRATKAAGGILLQSGSKLNMTGGSISGNTAKNGAGVYVSSDSYIHMYGGAVSNNTSSAHGAGMYLLKCDATLAGGTISGNSTATMGGGLYISGSQVKLSGTNIIGNTAKANGAGICTTKRTVNGRDYYTNILMTGGSVSENVAESSGGGILLQSFTTMTMEDGTVEKNRTGRDGGGIYVSTNCTFHMNGGQIRGNTAQRNGAGLYNYQSTANYNAGQITGNTATGNGGAMVMSGQGYVVNMKDGMVITGNTSANGGAIVVQGRSTLNMENVHLSGNTATTGNGGAIYLSTNSFLNIRGGTIENHDCEGYGGAIFSTTNSTLNVEGTIIRNCKAGYGGALSLGGTVSITGATISGCQAVKEGGGIYCHKLLVGGLREFHQINITDTLVENNTAGTQGGGIYVRRGSKCEFDGLTVTNNTAHGEGGGLYVVDDTAMYNLTVTGNTSGGEGYALYLADSQYDGESYFVGIFKLGGKLVVKDNRGGDMYFGNQTAAAVNHLGLTDGTHMNVKLHSGYLTQSLQGTYDYEGGNLEYVVTAGDRSVTDPEYDAAWNDLFNPEEPTEEPTQAPTDGNDSQQSGKMNPVVWIAAGAGAVVIAAVIAIIAVLSKKKKTAAGK